MLILKNLRGIGPTKYCNICMRGLKLPKNYTFNSKKKVKTQYIYHFQSFFVLLLVISMSL